MIAFIKRPCSSCPKPGIKKLQSAAITFPADPCSDMVLSGIFESVGMNTEDDSSKVLNFRGVICPHF